jgi:hypothetical protein
MEIRVGPSKEHSIKNEQQWHTTCKRHHRKFVEGGTSCAANKGHQEEEAAKSGECDNRRSNNSNLRMLADLRPGKERQRQPKTRCRQERTESQH